MPRTVKFARVLSVLHSAGFLDDPDCSGPIRDFIRKATEPTSNWHATAHYRSRAAAALLSGQKFTSTSRYHQFCSQNLSHEHVVPNKVLHDILLREPDLNEEIILRRLKTFGIRATITRDEDALIRKHGFSSAMPDGFWRENDPFHMDPFARYKAIILPGNTSIHDTLQPRVGESWLHVG